MKRCVAILPLVLLFGIALTGCDAPQQAGVAAPSNAPPPPPPPPPPPGGEAAESPPEPAPGAAPVNQPALPLETKVGVFAGGLDELGAPANPAPAPAPVETPDPNTEIVKAGKGVGAKGRSLDEHEGLYVTPVKAYFAARERIFFEAEFPKNYQIYNAMTDDIPKDFEDLKAKVLDPYGLTKKLPLLPQGHTYVWNPETQELGVKRPKR